MSEQADPTASDGTPDSLVGLLNQLIEPEAPAAIPMTPQTVGWVILLALILVSVVVLVFWGVRRRRANAYRRVALAGLDDAGDNVAEIATILRRTALAAWPRSRVANLAGDAWLAFLNRTGGPGTFPGTAGQSLIKAPYSNQVEPASEDLRASARRWVRKHKVVDAGGKP